MSKKVVMQDIADYLNISKNSVSQALSGKDGVSEETRNLIIKTADEMGYQYAQKNRPLPKQQMRTIGLIASEFAFSMSTFFGEIYLSIEKEAERHGTTLVIQSISPEARDQLIMPSFIADKSVDGVLILSHISTDYINKVMEQGIPTVLIDHHHPDIQADAILTNNRFGAYRAIQHLIDLNHRDIGIIGDIDRSPSYQERWEGYMYALQSYQLKPRDEVMLLHVTEEQTIIDKAIQSVAKQPTAWFCLNDGYSFFVNSSLQKLGIAVPKQISICGFDNSKYSLMANPQLTTIDINLKLFAHKAFSHLMWRMDHPHEVHQEILLPTNLIKRQSTDLCYIDEHNNNNNNNN